MEHIERWRVILSQGQLIFPARYVVIADEKTVYRGLNCCKAWRVFVQVARNGARWACCLVDGIEVARFVNGVPTLPRSPSQEEIDEKMRVLNQAVRQLEAMQAGDCKDQAKKALDEVYDWLAMRRIDFYYDAEVQAFRV